MYLITSHMVLFNSNCVDLKLGESIAILPHVYIITNSIWVSLILNFACSITLFD